MAVEAAVAIASGIAARSVTLVAFGLDSVIELASAGVLIWRLSTELRFGREVSEAAERIARRIAGGLLFALAVALLFVGTLPVAADLSTHSPEPAAGLADGSTPTIALSVGAGPAIGGWVSSSAAAALPPPRTSGPASASAQVWILPSIPEVTIAPNVAAFDQSAPKNANRMAHDAVLDLIIESEARRAHDVQLAGTGATADGLKEFVDVIKQDIAAAKIIQKTYSFDKVSLNLFLPKFSSQASRLIGVTLKGTSTFITRDASGNVLSQSSTPYSKSWGLDTAANVSHQVIINDFTDLAPAP